jgi:hypothetical protein
MQKLQKDNAQSLQERYQVELFYGWEDGECGTFHSFKAVDPQVAHDDDEIAAELAEQLDRSPDDDNFHLDSMYIHLPESLIKRIQEEAVKEYCERFCKPLSGGVN